MPVPNGTTGIFLSLHNFKIVETSSLVSGNTTAFEGTGSYVSSPLAYFALVDSDNEILSFKNKNQVAYIKGVGQDYLNVIPADSLVAVGEWLIPDSSVIVAGYGIGAGMDLGVYDYGSLLNISIPRKNQNSNLKQNL